MLATLPQELAPQGLDSRACTRRLYRGKRYMQRCCVALEKARSRFPQTQFVGARLKPRCVD